MNTEAKVAYINAQTAMMLAEMEMMKTHNMERERKGYAFAYGEEQWAEFINRWENVLGHNAVIGYLRD